MGENFSIALREKQVVGSAATHRHVAGCKTFQGLNQKRKIIQRPCRPNDGMMTSLPTDPQRQTDRALHRRDSPKWKFKSVVGTKEPGQSSYMHPAELPTKSSPTLVVHEFLT